MFIYPGADTHGCRHATGAALACRHAPLLTIESPVQASLGGAVAIDFAVSHPECVERLILMDAGGESYAQPDPFLTSLAADPVTNLFQWRATNGLLPYPHVWSKEENWRQSLRAYLKSGGYQRRVNPDLIKTVPVPTLVLWGEEDDVRQRHARGGWRASLAGERARACGSHATATSTLSLNRSPSGLSLCPAASVPRGLSATRPPRPSACLPLLPAPLACPACLPL